MLNEKYFPTTLIFPSERPRIEVDDKKHNLTWRGCYLIYQVLLLHLRLLKCILTNRFNHVRLASELRIFLETMGSLWIAAGQVIALRRDIFPLELSEELANLNESGKIMPFHEVSALIEKALGIVLADEFDQFSELPFASTIISQTHRAFLKSKKNGLLSRCYIQLQKNCLIVTCN